MTNNLGSSNQLRLHAAIVFVVGIFLLISSIFLDHIYGYKQGSLSFRFLEWGLDLKTYAVILRELGFAFLVAFSVTIIVEIRLRKLHMEQRIIEDKSLRRDVFNAIFGITSPRSVVDKALKLITDAKFSRRGYRATYFIERKTLYKSDSSDTKAIILTSFDEYIVKNNSWQNDYFQFKVIIEIEDKLFNNVNDKSILDIKNVRFFEMPKQEEIFIKDLVRNTTENPWKLVISCSLMLKPKQEILINFETSTLKREDDEEIFFSMFPTEGLTLEINCPNDLELKVIAIADTEARCLRQPNGGHPGEWKIDGVLLPYQGVSMKWRRRLMPLPPV